MGLTHALRRRRAHPAAAAATGLIAHDHNE
jgi:hypothetical protein